jgi:DICT domain-containing protein
MMRACPGWKVHEVPPRDRRGLTILANPRQRRRRRRRRRHHRVSASSPLIPLITREALFREQRSSVTLRDINLYPDFK